MASHIESKYIVGVYDDDEKLLTAIEKIRGRGVKIDNVYTPFPVHGIEAALGYKDSRLPDVAFIFGLTGTTLALLMQTYMYTVDWKVNVGGKSHFPFPSFIPITFELTVLLCALGMVGTYLYVNKLYPGKKAKLFDDRQTDDRFIVTVLHDENNAEANRLAHQALSDSGAIEVREQTL